LETILIASYLLLFTMVKKKKGPAAKPAAAKWYLDEDDEFSTWGGTKNKGITEIGDSQLLHDLKSSETANSDSQQTSSGMQSF
jgi:hypothetical protein